MAMTPSQLSIIVSSKGVASATVELDKLAKAAASVDAETKSFVIAQSKLAESNKKVSQSSEATARGVTTQELAMIKLHEAANRMNAAYIKQEEAQKKLINGSIEKALKEQADAAAKVAKAQEKLEKSELAAKLREQTKEAAAAKKEMEALAREADKLAKAQDKITKSTLSAEMRAQEKAMKATARAAAELEKAHGNALEMNKKFDARTKALQDNTNVVKMNARGISEQEFAMLKAHEQALKMNDAFGKKSKKLEEVNKHGSIWNNTLKSMATAALAYMGVNFVMGIVKQADAWAMMQSKLELATGSMKSSQVVQQELFVLAQKIRIPLEDSAKLYTRMSHPMMMLGKTSKDTIEMVESLGTALKLSGATGQEASSAMLQFSQAMNAGRLNGGEFNSIAEASPNILRAIEAELRRTGQWGEHTTETLKKMGSEGKISGELLARSLQNALPQMRKDFETLPLTFDGAMVRLTNAWDKAVGEMGKNTNFTGELAKSIAALEESLPKIANALGAVFNFVAQNLNGIITGITTLVGIGLASWLYSAKDALIGMGSVLKTVLTSMVAFAATPIGAAITGITLAVGAGVYAYHKYTESQDAAKVAAENLNRISPDTVKSMEAEYESALKQYKILFKIKDLKDDLAAQGQVSNLDKAYADVTELAAKLQAAINRGDKDNIAIYQDKMKVVTAEIARLKTLDDTTKALARVNAAEAERQANAKRVQALLDQYADDGEKKSKELEKLKELVLTEKERAFLIDKINKKYADKTSRDLTPELTNLDKANKLLADQITLNKEWEMSANKKATIGQRFSEDVEKENKALERSLESGVAHNKLLSEAEKRQIRKTLETNKEALAVAKIVEAQQKYREADQERIKRVDKAGEELLTEEARLEVLERQLNLGEQTNIAKQQQSIIEAEIALSALIQVDATGVELVNAQRLLKVRQDTLKVMQNQEYKDDNEAQAKKYEDSFQAANKKISDGLYNAIGKGGESAIKKLIQDIKSWFARLILKPIIDPISKIGASIISPNAASAQGGVGNIMEIGSTIYKSITTGFAEASAAAGSAFSTMALSSFGEAIGLSSTTAASAMAAEAAALTGSTLGASATSGAALTGAGSMGASIASAMPYVAAAVAAFQGVKAINGEYRLGGLSADMGALLGVMPRLFGMAEKKFADQTVTGNLGTTNLSRNQAWTQSGGLFRSDRADTWKYMLKDSTATTSDGKSYTDTANLESDKALLNQLTDMYSAVKVASTEYAKALGLNAESIKSRTDAINFTFGKTAEETSTNISKAFESITNNIAKDLLGSLTELALQNESYAATMGRLATNISTTNGMFKALGYNLFELNTNGIKAANSLVTLFGGLDKFQAIASDYYDKFYSESEKTQVKVDAMTKSLKDLGVELPSSRAAFRGLVEAAQKAGNNELYASLMKLSSAFAELTDESGNTVSRLGQLPQAMRDTFEALAKDAERWLNLSKSASSLRGSINEILTGASDNSAKKAEKLWKMLESDISVEQKMSIAGELKDTILAKYQVERDSITKLLDLSRQLKNFVEGLKVGSMSPLTTTQKLEEAKKQYESILAKAKGGDTTAQGALQGSATTYLDLARTALASGTEYRTIFDDITTSLDMFSVDTQTAEERMVELNKSQEIELMKLVSQLNTIESVADSYYKTNIAEMTKQLTVMQEMYIKLGNLDGIAVDLAKLPAEIAAVLAGKFGRTTGEQFIEGLYKQYTGKSAQEIDKQGMEYWTEELLKYGRDYTLKAFVDSVKPPPPVVSKPSDTTTILTNTVVQLKEEISALRDDQNKQTEALIAATVISNQENATEVVEGVDDAYNKKNWRDVNAPALV